ncbi:MAG: NPCBM/NEW2 domain-containing protein, partial [Clostridium sp.]|uniref:NPCBM/NEW2 domain-containing protein n=1 Tax=Clostridium sp. TaxID=1506 RepID=UPI002A90EC7C
MKKKGLSLILAGILVASAVLNPFSHNTVKAYAEESNNPRVVSEETQANKNYLYLSDIEYVANKSSVGYSSIKLDKNIDNGVIKLIKNGEVINFAKGVGAHAKSTLVYDIGKYSKDYTKFTANIGVDYSMRGRGNGVTFKISTSENGTYWKDVKTTGVITAKNESVLVDINIEGVKYLRLIAETNGGNEADHSVYADARLLKKGYNLNDDLYQGIKTLSQYDEEIKKVNLESNLSSSKEILQKRELVRRLGYETLQSNLRDNNKVKDTFDWLLNDKEALELFIEAGDISEAGRFINVLSNLYDKYKDCLSDEVNGTIYKKMMIALATGWSSDAGTSALEFNMNLPTFDAVGRFQIMKDFYDNDKLARKEEFKTYNMELMRMIMNNQMANEDLIWLNNYANKKYPN